MQEQAVRLAAWAAPSAHLPVSIPGLISLAFLYDMMPWPPSWKYDVLWKDRLVSHEGHSCHISSRSHLKWQRVLGFILKSSPKKKNKNKMSSDMGSLPDPKIEFSIISAALLCQIKTICGLISELNGIHSKSVWYSPNILTFTKFRHCLWTYMMDTLNIS